MWLPVLLFPRTRQLYASGPNDKMNLERQKGWAGSSEGAAWKKHAILEANKEKDYCMLGLPHSFFFLTPSLVFPLTQSFSLLLILASFFFFLFFLWGFCPAFFILSVAPFPFSFSPWYSISVPNPVSRFSFLLSLFPGFPILCPFSLPACFFFFHFHFLSGNEEFLRRQKCIWSTLHSTPHSLQGICTQTKTFYQSYFPPNPF